MASKYHKRSPLRRSGCTSRTRPTYSSVEKRLGVSPETLRNWVKQARKRQGETPAYQAPTSKNDGLGGYDAVIAEENRRLRAELDKVKAERDIPRKAAKSFAIEARLQIESWIIGYNTVRGHSSLGQVSPIDYENQRADLTRAA